MKEICIFGDSWSFQSWQKAPNMQEVAGSVTFQKLFADHNITAQNLSIQSCANKDMLAQINNNINLASQSDLIIVFQTDPIRDVMHRRQFRLQQDFDYTNYVTILDISRALLVKFYNELAQIQHNIGTPMLLVGGLSCLHFEAVPSNINTLPKSWTELVSPGYVDCFYEWIDFVELLALKLQTAADLDEIKKQIQAKNYIWQTSEYFSWCHPSDQGYHVMFNNLLSHIKDLQ